MILNATYTSNSHVELKLLAGNASHKCKYIVLHFTFYIYTFIRTQSHFQNMNIEKKCLILSIKNRVFSKRCSYLQKVSISNWQQSYIQWEQTAIGCQFHFHEADFTADLTRSYTMNWSPTFPYNWCTGYNNSMFRVYHKNLRYIINPVKSIMYLVLVNSKKWWFRTNSTAKATSILVYVFLNISHNMW